MKAIHRMLNDMDQLVTNCLQELRILYTDTDCTATKLCHYFMAIGALTTIAGAICGARRAIQSMEV
jgi:hypothetical protein